MPNLRNSALDYYNTHRERFLQDFMEILRIPSISTSPEHQPDIRLAADWLASRLSRIGLQHVSVLPTAMHPVVYADYLDAGPGAPTLLIYGHYDVQPVDPLHLWETPPFEPAVRGENLYARGASDMKGQVMACLSAVECALQAAPRVNLKFFIEGEEEIGSPSMRSFLIQHRDLLQADAVLNLDSGMLNPGQPAITYTLRGIAAFELRVTGPRRDLHSGMFGGAVHNPAQALAELVAGMHDAEGRVTLPGFYNRVLPLAEEERRMLGELPGGDAFYLLESGVPALWGEPEFTAVERIGARPTLEINGIHSGYGGEGTKTVIPSQAVAKITMRLVAEQRPEEAHQQLQTYLEQQAPPTITWELDSYAGGRAFRANLELPALKAFSDALETVWGRPVVYMRQGGGIPVAPVMQDVLGIDSVLSGFGMPDDQQHAPNEKQHLPTWRRGIQAIIHFLYNLGG